jgi:hypothetical protein
VISDSYLLPTCEHVDKWEKKIHRFAEILRDAQDDSKGAFVVILNEGCRSEGSL